MTRVDELRANADRQRAVFFQSAISLSDRLRPAQMLDNMLRAADPDFVILRRFETAVKQNPVALMAAVSGVMLLMQQLLRSETAKKPATRHGLRNSRLPRAKFKGDENGYNNDAKQHGNQEG